MSRTFRHGNKTDKDIRKDYTLKRKRWCKEVTNFKSRAELMVEKATLVKSFICFYAYYSVDNYTANYSNMQMSGLKLSYLKHKHVNHWWWY